jgi:KUP system potassium uptake protein
MADEPSAPGSDDDAETPAEEAEAPAARARESEADPQAAPADEAPSASAPVEEAPAEEAPAMRESIASRTSMAHAPAPEPKGTRLVALAFGAIGVVYGDIGTSPLYAFRECFAGEHGVHATDASDVLGIVSLIFWSILVVVVVKYLVFMMRADNEGEGGILALLALVMPKDPATRTRATTALVLLGLFGAALLYGDAIITPAISVLSAVEGLSIANELFTPLAVPISLVILVLLFLAQRLGTGRLGAVFGLVTLGWFVAIAACGVPAILARPSILFALSPHYAVWFFVRHGRDAFELLGSVVLCVTGGEALYADMGHFGKRAIRLAWWSIVYPALLLNYFGQGALLLAHPEEVERPFYALVPTEWLYPMIVLATCATVVASQALISGAFSLSRQAVQLGYFPRVTVLHTSSRERGQIFVPEINEAMMVGCLGLVVGFGSSSALAAAYGAAVTGTMTITSVLFYAVMRERLGQKVALRWLLVFLAFDLPFLGANLLKIHTGGWFPIAVAIATFAAMTTWQRGRAALSAYLTERSKPIDVLMEELEAKMPHRVPGTAVFMSSVPDVAPPVLLHHLRHNKVLHEHVILLNVRTRSSPEVPQSARVTTEDRGHGIHVATAHFGFMQTPSMPEVMKALLAAGLPAAMEDTTFYLGREALLPTGHARMARWRKRLFMFLSRNARSPTAYFRIPPDRVVEMGMQIEL